MQPVQLSLLPETVPAPSATLGSSPPRDRSGTATRPPSELSAAPTGPLPDGPVGEAVALMGRLIAAAAAHATADEREASDE